ncbi:hypothetical protein [Desulfoferrobacter suflitae]|uniref:hypothetical protein n=1 Tax=Desulfoferrobacter suflitae TaxID=2865782 RepID=UPI0021649353|nr:hypothetical protein [Desulfoferrobacter suflitae]MCK8603205.1 hypothetical protein [Desulfoferrobacter suflitae]
MKSTTLSLASTLACIADFYDGCKVGCEGFEGYRKSADLTKFIRCAGELENGQFINPRHTIFVDLGCADGRVNLLMSYFVKKSIGIEIDPDILGEYQSHAAELGCRLTENQLTVPPANISLFAGNSLADETFQRIRAHTGVSFKDVDIFYTYITLHDAFAAKIAAQAKVGSLYLVYGFNKILPRYDGLELLIADVASQGIATLYQKTA